MGRGGPILLLQSGCLGEGEMNGIGTASHLSGYARHRYSLGTAERLYNRAMTSFLGKQFTGCDLRVVGGMD